MEFTARLKYLQASPQKVRLVADLIRGKDVEQAAGILRLSKQHAARPLAKLLKSALANAEHREEAVDVGRLYVQSIHVDGGPSAKRIRPAPMGRAYRVLKRQSHVTIKLAAHREGGAAGGR